MDIGNSKNYLGILYSTQLPLLNPTESLCAQSVVMARAGNRGQRQQAIMSIQVVEACNVWGFRANEKANSKLFYKVTTSLPTLVTAARSAPEVLCLHV